MQELIKKLERIIALESEQLNCCRKFQACIVCPGRYACGSELDCSLWCRFRVIGSFQQPAIFMRRSPFTP